MEQTTSDVSAFNVQPSNSRARTMEQTTSDVSAFNVQPSNSRTRTMEETTSDVSAFNVQPSNSRTRTMEETTSDVSAFNVQPSNSRLQPTEGEPVMPGAHLDPQAKCYDMTGTKYLYVFNHFKYKETRYFFYKRPKQRNGTEKDVEKLKEVFGKLGYTIQVYNDLDHEEIIRTVMKESNRDHSHTSCICVAILTHGSENGDVYAADKPYQLNDVISIFAGGHPTLVGKPKLFFVQNKKRSKRKSLFYHIATANEQYKQYLLTCMGTLMHNQGPKEACRGKKTDSGRRIQKDGESHIYIPTHADMLVLYSTVDDHLSYRDRNGSWMIQALCDIVEKEHENTDILHIVTKVNNSVAYDRTSYAPLKRVIHNKKQMPETKFTLTKLFYF